MGIFVLVIGAVAIFGGVSLAVGVMKVKGWPTVQATVIERSVGNPDQPTGGTRNARYAPKVRYTFEVAGQKHEATGIGPVQESMTAEEAQAALAAIPNVIEVHYDPDDPSRAYIETGSLTFAIIVGLVGLLMALIGLGMLLSGKESSG